MGDYILDDKGYRLCTARTLLPITKEKADRIFSEFMQRVNEINNSDYYMCKIEKLYLFGSYLDGNKENYGDIDIGYLLKRKISNLNKFNKARIERVKELMEQGKRFNSFDDQLNLPEKEVKLKLKNKCRYISLQPIDDNFFDKVKYKKIYPPQKTNKKLSKK